MPALAHTSLTDTERRALDLLVPRLVELLGDDLVAVWLFGSRARGEPPGGGDSDVDVLVLTRRRVDQSPVSDLAFGVEEEEAGIAPGAGTLTAHVMELDRWKAGKEIDGFFQQEVERDAVVLYGPPPERAGAKRVAHVPSGDGMRPRSIEYMKTAQVRARGAREVIDIDPGGAISLSYSAVLNAARAALSERDVFARTHPGTWDRFHDHFVKAGGFDGALHQAAARLQKRREYADYGPPDPPKEGWTPPSLEEAEASIAVAERFLSAVRALFDAS